MDVNSIIISVMVVFAVIGGLDYISGSRLGMGSQFEAGIQTMGTMMMSMAGLLILTPSIASVLGPVIEPLFKSIGADPAMFAGIFFGLDMGAAPLALELTNDTQAAMLGGMITSSMLGATIVFTIPVGLGIINKDDRPFFAKGILTGIMTIPAGIIAGGLAAGIRISAIIINVLPVAAVSIIIMIGIWKFEHIMTAGFVWLGRFIVAVSIAGLLVGMLEYLIDIKLLSKTTSLTEVFSITGNIALMLAGAFPMVTVLTKVLNKPLEKLGALLGINKKASAGLLVSLANSIPMLTMVSDMDRRGKVMNTAFAVSAAYVFGDHLGFVAGYMPEMMIPVMIAKLTAGVTAVAVAYFITSKITTK